MKKTYSIQAWNDKHDVTVNFPKTRNAWFKMYDHKFEFTVKSINNLYFTSSKHRDDYEITLFCDNEKIEFDDVDYQFITSDKSFNDVIDIAVQLIVTYIDNRF